MPWRYRGCSGKRPYYLIARYYGPTWRLNGNTAKDIIYDGTALEDRFETVQFE